MGVVHCSIFWTIFGLMMLLYVLCSLIYMFCLCLNTFNFHFRGVRAFLDREGVDMSVVSFTWFLFQVRVTAKGVYRLLTPFGLFSCKSFFSRFLHSSSISLKARFFCWHGRMKTFNRIQDSSSIVLGPMLCLNVSCDLDHRLHFMETKLYGEDLGWLLELIW